MAGSCGGWPMLVKWTAAAGLAIAFLGIPVVDVAAENGGGRWHQVVLEEGETSGFSWSGGARLPAHRRLDKICVAAGFTAPVPPDQPYRESSSLAVCGSLAKAKDSVSLSATLGSSGTTFLAVVYRPAVRKVVFLLNNGQRRVFRPRIPQIPDRAAMGIPVFRYLVATFDGGACVRRTNTFNASGDVVSKEGEPCSARSATR